MSTTPPGWYHDPWRQAPMRWWDGSGWTEHLADWHGHVPAARPPRAAGGPSPMARVDAEERITPWLKRLLYLWPVAAAASAGFAAVSIQRLVDAFRNDGDVPPVSGWGWVAQVASAIVVALLVVRMVWLHRATTTARDLGFPVRRTPTAAAVGWLVPVINLWWPLQSVTDLFPVHRRPDRRLAWWWACSIVASLAPLAGAAVPYVPVPAAVAILVAAVAPTIAAAVLELGLVSEAVAVHVGLAGAGPA
jgi:Domain of unknown function (DUF4328)/Protein of unknown function (DUF2510)